jgi:hypothetical protein
MMGVHCLVGNDEVRCLIGYAGVLSYDEVHCLSGNNKIHSPLDNAKVHSLLRMIRSSVYWATMRSTVKKALTEPTFY